MDFSIWSILETKACAASHSSIESLKRSLTRAWEQIPEEIMRAAVEAFPRRLRAVVQKKGGVITHVHIQPIRLHISHTHQDTHTMLFTTTNQITSQCMLIRNLLFVIQK